MVAGLKSDPVHSGKMRQILLVMLVGKAARPDNETKRPDHAAMRHFREIHICSHTLVFRSAKSGSSRVKSSLLCNLIVSCMPGGAVIRCVYENFNRTIA